MSVTKTSELVFCFMESEVLPFKKISYLNTETYWNSIPLIDFTLSQTVRSNLYNILVIDIPDTKFIINYIKLAIRHDTALYILENGKMISYLNINLNEHPKMIYDYCRDSINRELEVIK